MEEKYSLAAKYVLVRNNNYKNTIGLWGQVAFSQESSRLHIYPELKILFFRKLTQSINIISNLGGALTARNTLSFVYSAELKMQMTKKSELIIENFYDCVHLNSKGKPSNRFLIGIGSYFRENCYMYLTCERGTSNSDLQILEKWIWD